MSDDIRGIVHENDQLKERIAALEAIIEEDNNRISKLKESREYWESEYRQSASESKSKYSLDDFNEAVSKAILDDVDYVTNIQDALRRHCPRIRYEIRDGRPYLVYGDFSTDAGRNNNLYYEFTTKDKADGTNTANLIKQLIDNWLRFYHIWLVQPTKGE